MFGCTDPTAAKSHSTPSLEESRRQVQESLERRAQEVDHDEILAGLQDEIDKHNAIKHSASETMRRSKRRRQEDRGEGSERSTRFRFKDGQELPRKKHRHRRSESQRRRDREDADDTRTTEKAAHPFPRESEPSTVDDHVPTSADAAFRTSLFDALADDEGAQYWESVYAQPIHVYSRPVAENPQGELESMSDEQYAAHVKMKMWERKHPEIVLERERSRGKQKEEEEARTRRREEFVRRREQAAWERTEQKNARRHAHASAEESEADERREHAFAGEANSYADTPQKKARRSEYEAAWKQYLAAWDRLKLELLDERSAPPTRPQPPSKRLPWPVLESKPVIRANIEKFMQHAVADEERTKLQSLKAERVRWHPDKVQQRFAGAVDEGTMKLVTGVFQVVDALFEEERKKAA